MPDSDLRASESAANSVLEPYPGLGERKAAEFAERLRNTEEITSPFAGAPASVGARLRDRVAEIHPELVRLSSDLHAHPELAYAEHHAVAAIAASVAEHGIDIEVGAYDVPTAFRAVVGTGRPRVAVVAEYDALPEIGHACGHNIIAASAVGAFLALADWFTASPDTPGAVELIGTPAEEGGGGKQKVLDAGGFDDVDFALMVHPGNIDSAGALSLGFHQVSVTYRGKAAHASAAPYAGVNALDAVVAAYNGISQLRQHILPSDRIHGIITDGGQAPNIVPVRASATFFVRSANLDTLSYLRARVDAILRAASASSGAAVEITWDTAAPYLPLRSNEPLEARYAVNLADRRRLVPAGVRTVEESASTDMGNVSVYVPSIHPMVSIAPRGVSNHTAAFTEYAGGPAAAEAIADSAVGLATTAADFLTDADLREAANADFEARGGRLDLAAALGAVD